MAKTDTKKNKKWIKRRHGLLTYLTGPFFWLFVLLKYGVAVRPFRERKRQYLILMNHQTSSDQFFVGLTFYRPLYYVASEDIFSNGLVSSLLKFALNPIPINKSAADMRAIINCIKVVKEGGSIVIAPEGNRTYSGKTCHIKPSIVQLARKLGLPIAIFRIEGGYGVQPRWTDKNRRGKISFGVSEVIEPETYSGMTDGELYERIKTALDVNEAAVTDTYKSKRAAEYIERLLYVCPDCGLTEYKSAGNVFFCTSCGKRYVYTGTKQITCENGCSGFEFAADFYDFQEQFVRSLDIGAYVDKPAFTDKGCRIFSVELCKRKKLLSKDLTVRLFSDRIQTESASGDESGLCCSFDQVRSVSLLGRNKMNIRTPNGIYQIRGGKSFNPVKYMNFFYHYKFKTGGKNDAFGNTEFLGL